MAVRTRAKALRSCLECGQRENEKVRVMKLLTDALNKMEEKFAAKDFKPSLADFLKLLQMEKEFDQEMAKEIKVTWVETPAESKDGK